MKRPLWFKAKNYGYGWYPATWQGWLILAVFIVLIIWDFTNLNTTQHSVSDLLINWIPDIFFLTLLLTGVCWVTGEKPEWRWGKKE